MSRDTRRTRTGLKRHLLGLLRAGTGSLVIASAVLPALPAESATTTPPATDPTLTERAADARSRLLADLDGQARPKAPATQLAWWGNWHNWGPWHPWWHNWPNWRNWHNWGNW